ncbi:MAG: hypothetical protein QT10_C0011G0047 [archaeon GW2011_AR19]|nr:MAG: hypothetical protein QT10_C0011G0047 [archaeon GW2011_AR19]
MNWLKKLFKKKLDLDDLIPLLKELGKSKGFISNLYAHQRKEYTHGAYGKLDVKKVSPEKIRFDLDIQEYQFHRGLPHEENTEYNTGKTNVTKTFSYQEIEKNPVLKKYVKKRNLESSLSILSIALILASTFFISNNITGNAILTATPNSSGIIGAGLFVLGVISFILARNI